jgi:hypothetical protein
MTTKVLIKNGDERASDFRFQASDSRFEVVRKDSCLNTVEVEERLQQLNDRLQNVNAASYLIWLKSGVHRFDPVLDLRVKVEAVRWMLRIAKHLNDGARETVFLTVMNSLDQLEKAVESGVSAHEAGVDGAKLISSKAHATHASTF